MKRRHFFLSSISGMLLAHRIIKAGSMIPEARLPEMKNWVWMKLHRRMDLKKLEQAFNTMREAGIHAVLPEVYPGYRTYFQSSHLPSGTHWLDQFIPLAKDAGLEIHAWMWSMICNIEEIKENHKDWFVVNGRGESCLEKPAYVGYYNFLCPNHPDVQQFVRRTVEALSDYQDLDGVHLDYIRFPDVILAKNLQKKYGIVQDREYPEYDYCYCETCRSMFREQHGRDPLKLTDPEHDMQWRQFRYDSITNLVNDVLVPAARDKGKKVTAAVFPNGPHVRQEWSMWKVDGLMPMLYHHYYDEGLVWIRDKTSEGVQSLKNNIPLFSGLDIRSLSAEEFRKVVVLCREAGAAGISLFAFDYVDEDHWRMLADSMKKMP